MIFEIRQNNCIIDTTPALVGPSETPYGGNHMDPCLYAANKYLWHLIEYQHLVSQLAVVCTKAGEMLFLISCDSEVPFTFCNIQKQKCQ